MEKRTATIVVIIVVALLCACAMACGAGALMWTLKGSGGESGTVVAATVAPTTESTVIPLRGTVASAQATPQGTQAAGGLTIKEGGEGQTDATSGGTLRMAGDLPPTLDPAMVQDSTSAFYVVHIFSGLVSLDANLEVVPDLAESWDLENEDRTYVFHLNSSATFADGTAITADDFVYSWERACSPALDSPVAATYLGDVLGVAAYASGQADAISGMEVRDAHTLAVTIDAPKAYFLAKLTYPVAMVVDRAHVERGGQQWVLDPNGSGPFALASITSDEIVLERNTHYYGEPAHLDQVQFDLGSGLPITMYENDEIDIAGVYSDELDRVEDPYNSLSQEVYTGQEFSVEYLAMDVTQPPFDDPAVRQAIMKAIDRQRLAELVLNNSAVAARGILPPGLATQDPDPAAAVMAYDPEGARRLLATSKYAEDMPPIVLSISGTSGYMPGMIEAVVAMLEENLGLTITVEQVEWSSFLDDLNERQYSFYESAWMADYPDPQNFLDLLFHSLSAQNHSGYANAEVDALLEQARVEQDHDQRMALYAQAEVLILQDAPWVPLTHGESYTLVKPYVKGYNPAASLSPWLKDIYLER